MPAWAQALHQVTNENEFAPTVNYASRPAALRRAQQKG
jgi:hypothetical protein